MESRIGYRGEWRAPGHRLVRIWNKPNAKGEKIVAEFVLCRGGGDRRAIQKEWLKAGLVDRVFDTWWKVTVQATDARGFCRALHGYDLFRDTLEDGTRVEDYRWLLEATPENIEVLSAEIERRAFGDCLGGDRDA